MKGRWPFLAAGVAGTAVPATVIFALAERLHPAGAAASVLAMMSLAYPAVALCLANPKRDRVRPALVLAGGLAGLLAFVLIASPGAVPRAVASMLVLAAATASFGAMGWLLARSLGERAGPALGGGLLAALVALPFWSAGLYRAGHWIAGRLLVIASPFLAVMLPWTDGGPWEFDPRTSGVLYDIWIGTDAPLVLPGWPAAFFAHALFAGATAAAVMAWRRFRGRLRS